jgi:hypothetical protein
MQFALLKKVAQVFPGARIRAGGHEAGGVLFIGAGLGLLTVYSAPGAFTLLLAAGVMLAALLAPASLGYLIVVGTVLMSGMERGSILPYLRANEIMLAASAALAALVLLPMYGPRLDLRKVAAPLCAFGCLFLGTALLPLVIYSARGEQFTASTALGLVSSLQYLLLLLIFALLPISRRHQVGLLITMVVLGALVAAVGLLQAAQVGPVISLLQTWYPSKHAAEAMEASRVTSLIGAWNALGMFLMASILIGWVTLNHLAHAAPRLLVLAAMGLCAGCLLASGSFAGLLTLLLGIVLVELLTGRGALLGPKLLLGVAITALVLVIFLPVILPLLEQRLSEQYQQEGWTRGIIPATLSYRFWVWGDVFWPHIAQNWLLGSYLEVPYWFDWQYEESQYVMLLFRYGAVGAFFYALWVLLSLGWLRRRLRQPAGLGQDIAATAFALLTLLSLAGLTNAVMSYSGVADYMWILFGLVAGSRSEQTA